MYTLLRIKSMIMLLVLYYGQLLWSVDTESMVDSESIEKQPIYSSLCERITPKNGQALRLCEQVYAQLLEKNLIKDYTIFYNHEQNMLYVKSTQMQPPMRALDFIRIMVHNKLVTKNDIDQLLHNYKIHVMPAAGQLVSTIISIAVLLKKDVRLASLVPCVKLFPDYEKKSLSSEGEDSKRMPGIILYVPFCRDRAQYVLNTLYTELKGVSGANKCPRYSGQVTDLLFVAQGNGDEKEVMRRGYETIYKVPEKIYYDLSTFLPSFKMQYHLDHPRTRKAITTSYQLSEE